MARSGFEALDAFADKIESLKDFAKDTAEEARADMQSICRKTAAAGTDPYGTPWKSTVKGDRAIPNAADAVDVVTRGPFILIRVYRGAAIQTFIHKHQRKVIFHKGDHITDDIKDAIVKAANRVIAR